MVEIKETPYNHLEYHGSIGELYKIWLKNLLLKIITLGAYSFWARVNIRKYYTSSFSLIGDNFQYHGNAKELIKGFGKTFPIYAFAIFCSHYSDVNGDFLGYLLATILLFAAFYYSSYGALRYKLARTTWRGIRGQLQGSALTYTSIRLKNLVFGTLTFGYLTPKYDIEAFEYKMNNIYYGNVRLRFKGNWKDLHKTNIKTLLLFIPTLGFSRIWYMAALYRYVYTYTKIGDLRFQTTLTGWVLFRQIFLVLFIVIFTLGFGLPIVYHLDREFVAKHFMIEGFIETSKIMQAQKDASAAGDMMEGMLDDDGGGFF